MTRSVHLFALLGVLATQGLLAQNAEDHLRDGNRSYRQGEFEQAATSYREAMSADPGDHRVHFNLGNAHHAAGEFDAAEERFRAAAEASEDRLVQARAFHNLGNTFLAGKQPKPAVDAYKEALRRDPTDEDTRYNLALAQRLLKEQEEQEQEDEQDEEQEDEEDEEDQEDQEDKEGDQDDEQEEDDEGEQEKDPDGDQEEDGEQEQEQEQGEGDEPQDQESQPKEERPEGISPEDAQRLLDALDRQENEIQEKVQQKQRPAQRTPGEKDW